MERPKEVAVIGESVPLNILLKDIVREYNTEKYKSNNYPIRSKVSPRAVEKAIGRNEPCPCSSGKKYKKCCGV